MEIINTTDLLLLPFEALFFYIVIRQISKKAFPDKITQQYFRKGFLLKLLGVIGYSLLVRYYYGYGDSYNYYYGSQFIHQSLASGKIGLLEFFEPAKTFSEKIVMESGYSYAQGMMKVDSNLLPMKLFAILSFFSFGKFLIMSLFTCVFSFLGTWQLFRVASKIMKDKHTNLLAWAILYSPTICFWGSGLLKEAICIGCLGFAIGILYKAATSRKLTIIQLIMLSLCFTLLYIIKNYIVIIFAVSLIISAFYISIKLIKNFFLKFLIITFLTLVTAISFSLFDFSTMAGGVADDTLQQAEEFKNNYEKLQEADETSKAAIKTAIDFSVGGIILKSPIIILGCLFRPFIFESTKIIIFLCSLESTLLLFAVIKLMIAKKRKSFMALLFSNGYTTFCFFFTILFALIVGFTTFNLGTLVRYKIIFLPFEYFLLVHIYSNVIKKKEALATS